MAEFRGTTGLDNLIGANGVADQFRFRVGHLGSDDTVVGGDGPVEDQLSLSQPGTVNPALFAGVSGIEAIRLHTADVALGLSDVVLGQNGGADGLTVYGSNGADVVNADAHRHGGSACDGSHL
jgi:hypothetical protein